MSQTVQKKKKQKAGEHPHIYSSIHGIHVSSILTFLPFRKLISPSPDGSFSLPAVTNFSVLGSSEEHMVSCSTTVLRHYFY